MRRIETVTQNYIRPEARQRQQYIGIIVDVTPVHRSYSLSQKNMIERDRWQIPQAIGLAAAAKNDLQADLGVAGNQIKERNTKGRRFIEDYGEFPHVQGGWSGAGGRGSLLHGRSE